MPLWVAVILVGVCCAHETVEQEYGDPCAQAQQRASGRNTTTVVVHRTKCEGVDYWDGACYVDTRAVPPVWSSTVEDGVRAFLLRLPPDTYTFSAYSSGRGFTTYLQGTGNMDSGALVDFPRCAPRVACHTSTPMRGPRKLYARLDDNLYPLVGLHNGCEAGFYDGRKAYRALTILCTAQVTAGAEEHHVEAERSFSSINTALPVLTVDILHNLLTCRVSGKATGVWDDGRVGVSEATPGELLRVCTHSVPHRAWTVRVPVRFVTTGEFGETPPTSWYCDSKPTYLYGTGTGVLALSAAVFVRVVLRMVGRCTVRGENASRRINTALY
ncbi:ORF115 [Ranid herpesvirus 1]|uniref:ORF115 n=1 Tax=Ranid herpesvirus 1 TaxID=85655 RepID=Q14VL5_9VIRU|nr:ORF115 [Ranid herpesvirus 1]ABG25753.1 ORF115 [Ranid herpesvirus 1]